MITFHRSLYISFFLHMLAFGSAVAFAQFSRGALLGERDAILVSLADPDKGPQGGAAQRVEHHALKVDGEPIVRRPSNTPVMQQELPAQQPAAREEVSTPMVQEGKKTGSVASGEPGDLHEETGNGTTGHGLSTQFGLLSAEQWAVMESSIERSRSYPRMARERGIQGVVHVRFWLRPSGDVERVEVVKSSGYDILDSASVRTVYRAAPLPYVNGWVEVPLVYVLK